MTDAKAIVDLLQKRGVVEIRKITSDSLTPFDTKSVVMRFEKYREKTANALSRLNEVTKKKTPISALMSQKRIYSEKEFEEKTENLERTLKIAEDILISVEKSEKLKSEITHLESENDELALWKKLKFSLDFSGTDETVFSIGSVKNEESFLEIASKLENIAYLEKVFSENKTVGFFAVYLKENKEKTESVLKKYGFSSLNKNFQGRADEIIAGNTAQIENFSNEIIHLYKKVKSYEIERENLEFAIDFLNMKIEKYEAISKFGVTENTLVLRGYIPEKYAVKLVGELEEKFPVAVLIMDTGDDEDVPVMLENSRFSAPVESITEMYALPKKKDIDPTGVMSFFYYLFFGLMLSDAGYGVVIVSVTLFVLRKLKGDSTTKRTMEMFFYSGISTVFWGALFGSWFGDLPQVIAREFFSKEIGSLALWFEPLTDPIKLLIFSFALGIVHLLWGVAVKFSVSWKAGRKTDAFLDAVPIYLTVLGIAPAAAGILIDLSPKVKTVGMYTALLGAVMILLTAGRDGKNIFLRIFGGVYALYNTATGYLSDILSYSRLLALGLATGSIASVINLIGTMPKNMTVKIIMFLIVFIIGHTANIAINLLGAYVHTARLQFVELFSKFYEGGGRKFKPLSVNTKYIDFSEENE